MSKSYKHLTKLAEAAKVAKVANPETQSAKSGGGAGVAANPGALKIELINAPIIFSQTNAVHDVIAAAAYIPAQIDAPSGVSEEPLVSAPSPFEAPEVATPSVDTPLAQEPLESQGMAATEGPARETVTAGAEVPESIQARVYAKPLNPRMRLIEFITGPRVGEHGQLWVKDETQIMLNWRVWVKPDVNRPNPPGLHWVMDGQYNWRGIRVK